MCPDVDDLVVAFVVGDEAHCIVVHHFLHLFVAFVDDSLLFRGNDHVAEVERKAAAEGHVVTHVLDVVEELGGAGDTAFLDDLADDGANNEYVQSVREYSKKDNCEVFVICAQIEQEISELDDDEKKMFLEDLGISSSGLDKLIAASYRILGLISYLTAGETETRAWTITNGTKAPGAAGKIHSDFERGFIKAEVVNYKDLLDCGSYTKAKEKGLVRMEGKDYVVKDGDVILFRFNV